MGADHWNSPMSSALVFESQNRKCWRVELIHLCFLQDLTNSCQPPQLWLKIKTSLLFSGNFCDNRNLFSSVFSFSSTIPSRTTWNPVGKKPFWMCDTFFSHPETLTYSLCKVTSSCESQTSPSVRRPQVHPVLSIIETGCALRWRKAIWTDKAIRNL